MARKRTKVLGAATLIGLFVAVLIGVTLLDPFADELQATLYQSGNTSLPTNITGATLTIMSLLPLFFALAILIVMVKWGIGRG